jgi:hypothetical protein
VFSLRALWFLKILVLAFFVNVQGGALRGEAFQADPQDLLDRALKNYLAQENFSGRSLSMSAETVIYWKPAESLAQARHQVGSVHFQLTELKLRPPSDYFLLVDSGKTDAGYGERMQRRFSWKRGDSAFSGLLETHSGKLNVRPVAPSEFLSGFAAAAAKRGNNQEVDLVFKALVSRVQMFGTLSWGLGSPRLVETKESPDGEKLHCIEAQVMPARSAVLVWIREPSLRFERVVMLVGGLTEWETEGVRHIKLRYFETVYDHDEAPLLRDEDFAEPSAQPVDLLQARYISRFQGPSKGLPALEAQIEAQIPSVIRARAEQERLEKQAERARAEALRTTPTEKSNVPPELLKDIVIIEGDAGVGTGFVTKLRDVDFVVTNLHVLGANKTVRLRTMDGGTLPYTAIYGAIGRDVALFKIAKREAGLKLAESVAEAARVGKSVRVVGNYNGGGVANQVTGSIKGVGPDRIEVDAPFAPGNSGSPIICQDSGVVLGVASYRSQEVDYAKVKVLADWSQVKPSLSRWFGYRLDGPMKWELIELSRWNEQYRRVEDFNALSRGMVTAITRTNFDSGQHPRVLSLLREYRARISRVPITDESRKAAQISFLHGVRSLGEADAKALDDAELYDFFRSCLYWETNITAQRRLRTEILSAMDDLISQRSGLRTKN